MTSETAPCRYILILNSTKSYTKNVTKFSNDFVLAFQALSELVEVFPSFSFDESNALSVMRRLYVAKHDPEDYVRELADKCVFQLKSPYFIASDVMF